MKTFADTTRNTRQANCVQSKHDASGGLGPPAMQNRGCPFSRSIPKNLRLLPGMPKHCSVPGDAPATGPGQKNKSNKIRNLAQRPSKQPTATKGKYTPKRLPAWGGAGCCPPTSRVPASQSPYALRPPMNSPASRPAFSWAGGEPWPSQSGHALSPPHTTRGHGQHAWLATAGCRP